MKVMNHKEAVLLIEESLLSQMNAEDKLHWYYSRLIESAFPTIATIFNKYGEATDHGAIIIENSEGY